jgi:hypothetical protein
MFMAILQYSAMVVQRFILGEAQYNEMLPWRIRESRLAANRRPSLIKRQAVAAHIKQTTSILD